MFIDRIQQLPFELHCVPNVHTCAEWTIAYGNPTHYILYSE